MIQRKQTIFLLLALLAVILCLCLPIGRLGGNMDGGSMLWYNLGVYTTGGFIARPVPFVDLCITGTLTFICIFLYKKRPVQIKLCWINILLSVLWYAYYAFALFVETKNIGEGQISFAACLPLVNIILQVLAMKGIKADENLIKSMDRIR